MKVTREMVDEDLRGRYAFGRIIASFVHTRWFSLLVFRFSAAILRGSNIRGLVNEERHIPSRNGGAPIRVRIYRPTAAIGPLPIMLYLHGGGYVHGVPEQFGSILKDFIDTEPCIIVAPDYRKAAQSPYPAAFNDCYDTLLWIRDHAASLGGRTDKFVVSGHSAGGGLAAAVSLKATDTGDAKIAFQMPLYPMIDDRQTSASVVGNDAPVWDERANRLAWSRYLEGVKTITPYAAAARCTDYTKIPPTITFVGSLEPFRDETKIYVENLRRANIPVEFEVFDGAYHGFDMMVPDAPISKRAHRFLMENFRNFAQRYCN
ncbi:alpha/beta hydrolase [Bradyrhizobium sp. WYCCWR 13023]|uniref:Alpha/beta hydrolase n=1 Tax=Bradyrhizobium zhengyangense TaxID=2911009 RepID=A0A9X1UE41_9BRAD|nr:alpha/beta hydrolase [Bradyrhizobium zhengyangense]MCG2631633.1 alpha/beta hydrolase [Bradyrhizobium zhengyangense]